MFRSNLHRKLFWGGLFALSMGYFEAALVEYLRELYYPDGFAFPLKDIPVRLISIELGREAASILMLASVGALMGTCFIDRFAGFMYGFGVWDITYYLFLYLFEGWPPSLLTDDLLFLIPAPWVGPVWAPMAVSVGLIWAAFIIWRRLDIGIVIKLTFWEWIGEIIAGMVIIGSFLAGSPAVLHKQPLPPFPWYIWMIGMLLGLGLFVRAIVRTKSQIPD
ncbi:MAG: hypothetical protein P9M15_04470 [Candidatus Electryoneaceae bacterium]|nr:hypothetical protein [Candidatus Electryoneaceae bacterium]